MSQQNKKLAEVLHEHIEERRLKLIEDAKNPRSDEGILSGAHRELDMVASAIRRFFANELDALLNG